MFIQIVTSTQGKNFPVLTFASGPTNSARGAAILANLNSKGVFSPFKGCFVDSDPREYNMEPIELKKPYRMTVEHCRKECGQRKFLYAALQNGNECRCGNTWEEKRAILHRKEQKLCKFGVFSW